VQQCSHEPEQRHLKWTITHKLNAKTIFLLRLENEGTILNNNDNNNNDKTYIVSIPVRFRIDVLIWQKPIYCNYILSDWRGAVCFTLVLGVSMGRIGSVHIILLFFWSDSNPIRLNSGQKIMIHTRPDPTRIK
jgi:hypothetical protein